MLGVDVVWMKYSVCLPKSCPFTSLRACISLYFCVSDASLTAQAPLAFCLWHNRACFSVYFCLLLCVSVCFCVFLYASVYFPGSDCHVRYFSCRTSCTWILSQPDDALCAFCTSQIYQMWTQIYQPWTSHLSNSSNSMHGSFLNQSQAFSRNILTHALQASW